MRFDRLAKPTITGSAPMARLSIGRIGIDPPMPATAACPHSARRASSVAASQGESTGIAVASPIVWSRKATRASAGSRARM